MISAYQAHKQKQAQSMPKEQRYSNILSKTHNVINLERKRLQKVGDNE